MVPAPVVVSLFVNPIQFGEGEDLDCYPRNFDRDCNLADETGATVLFSPEVKDVYPEGFLTYFLLGIKRSS